MHAITLIATLLTLASSSAAPSADEQRLFDEGTRALQAGDARGAEKAWQAGYAIGHDPAFLVHIGEAEEKYGATAQAADAYRRYLREAPDASDRADIEQRLARLAPPAPASASASATPEATGEFGGTPPPADVPAAGAARSVPPARAPSVDAEHPPTPAQPEDSGWNRYNVTAVAATGATVLLLGTAGFFAAKAGSDADDINRLVIYRGMTGAPSTYSAVAGQYQQAMDDGRRHDRYAKAALIGAAGAAVVATVFYVLDAKLTPEPAVAIAPTGTGLGALGSWSWRF